MARRRVPEKDSDFATYLTNTRDYLAQRFKEDITRNVGASSTENLIKEEALPGNLSITIENTGAAGLAPDLHFCMAEGDTDACDTATSVSVAADSTEERTVNQLGGADKLNLNVTNAHATEGSSCRVAFPFNWQRLGLVQEQLNTWHSLAGQWLEKYLLTQDPSKRTTTLVSEKNTLKKKFTAFAGSPLNLIAASLNLLQADRDIFNIPERDRVPTPRPVIGDAPFTNLKAGGGSTIKFTHRRESDADRASIHPDANAVETRWKLVDIGAQAPKGPEECPNVEISTRSIHTVSFGVANAGKRLYAYSRWRNSREVHKSGPFGQRMTIVLSD